MNTLVNFWKRVIDSVAHAHAAVVRGTVRLLDGPYAETDAHRELRKLTP